MFTFLFVIEYLWNVLIDCLIGPAVLTTKPCECQKFLTVGRIYRHI